jgi:hypothetical protein
MRQICVFLLLLTLALTTYAQKKRTVKPRKPATAVPVLKGPAPGDSVKPTSYGGVGVFITPSYFKETEKGLIKKIGAAKLEDVKAKCSSSGWPEGFFAVDYSASEEEQQKTYQKMNELKMYALTTYTHIYNGRKFGEIMIVQIPYEENKNWKPEMKWEGDLYLLIPLADIKKL